MIKCLLRYYMKASDGRIVRFERTAIFTTVPYLGTRVSLSDDCLDVEEIEFREETTPVVILKTESLNDNDDVEETIREMQERGWNLASDVVRPKRK